MGRRKGKSPSKGTRFTLEELGVLQGRARGDHIAQTINAQASEIQAAVDTLMAGLASDPPMFGKVDAPSDPARAARVAVLALRSLRTDFEIDVDHITRHIAEAVEREQREHDAVALQKFRDALAKAYDRTGIAGIWSDLVAAGLVTEDPVPYAHDHNWIAHPIAAEREVNAYFDGVIQQCLPPITTAYSDVFESLVESCGAEPVALPSNDQLDNDFPTGPAGVWVKVMNADLDDTRTRQYAPILIRRVKQTSKMVIQEISLPRAKAVGILRGFCEVIMPHVRSANQRPMPFSREDTSALFYLAPQTVPHFLGARNTGEKRTGIVKTLFDMNEYGDTPETIRRSDMHLEMLLHNIQCVSVLYVRPPLCVTRLKILETDIEQAGQNGDCDMDDIY